MKQLSFIPWVVWMCLFCSSAGALEYQITIIDPNDIAGVQGINDKGDIVGSYENDVMLWQNGMMTILPNPVTSDRSYAVCINNSGRMGLTANSLSAGVFSYILDNGIITYLDAFDSDLPSWIQDMNNAGISVGRAQKWVGSQSVNYATMWLPNSSTPVQVCTLSDLTFSIANAINDHNEITGRYQTSTDYKAFIYDSVSGTRIIEPLAGYLWSEAYDINNSSQVVGHCSGSSYTQIAFLYDANTSTMTTLELLEGATKSRAFSINDSGLILGYCTFPDSSTSYYCVWYNGHVMDINTLLYTNENWAITKTIKVNNSGQIVAYAKRDGMPYYVLMTPIGRLDDDKDVDMQDFAIFASLWQQSNCSDSNNWCSKADINHNGQVDIADLGKMTEHWLEGI